jgi:curved DNA-binding protein CbpA
MTDYFAVMHETRRPWIDSDLLKRKFLDLSKELHPDRTPGQTGNRFAELNTAYQCLRETRGRLLHFLEVETGAKPERVDEVPADLTELFFEVGRVCREADACRRELLQISSPLLKVHAFERGQESMLKLSAIQDRLRARIEGLHDRTRQLDAEWMQHRERSSPPPPELLGELAQIYRLLGYFDRWRAQVQERIVQLSL